MTPGRRLLDWELTQRVFTPSVNHLIPNQRLLVGSASTSPHRHPYGSTYLWCKLSDLWLTQRLLYSFGHPLYAFPGLTWDPTC
jgi:hypothetical protein